LNIPDVNKFKEDNQEIFKIKSWYQIL